MAIPYWLFPIGDFLLTIPYWPIGYAILYVGTVPDIPNIHKILTNIGHRFVHQSGLDESPGQKSTICLHRIAFRVYLLFSRMGKNRKYYKRLT